MHILMSFFCSPSGVLLCSSVDGAPRARIFRGRRHLDEALAEFDTSSAAQLDTFREASVHVSKLPDRGATQDIPSRYAGIFHGAILDSRRPQVLTLRRPPPFTLKGPECCGAAASRDPTFPGILVMASDRSSNPLVFCAATKEQAEADLRRWGLEHCSGAVRVRAHLAKSLLPASGPGERFDLSGPFAGHLICELAQAVDEQRRSSLTLLRRRIEKRPDP